MAHELAVDKCNTGLTMLYETREKMMLKFARPGEKFNAMMGRVCEDLTKDVHLPKPVLDRIARQIAENAKRREIKRSLERK